MSQEDIERLKSLLLFWADYHTALSKESLTTSVIEQSRLKADLFDRIASMIDDPLALAAQCEHARHFGFKEGAA